MFDHHLRLLKDRLLTPVARALGPGLSPLVITWTASAVGLGSAAAVAAGRPHVALTLWLLNRLLDGLDGTHARVHGRVSHFGAYLDIVLDFVVYAAIPLGVVAADRTFGVALAGALLLGAFYVNAASWMFLAAVMEQRDEGARARGEATTVTMPPGLVAGTETVLFYTLFLLLPQYAATFFTVMALLVLVNVAMRLTWASRAL